MGVVRAVGQLAVAETGLASDSLQCGGESIFHVFKHNSTCFNISRSG
jgi:hypothetical protein